MASVKTFGISVTLVSTTTCTEANQIEAILKNIVFVRRDCTFDLVSGGRMGKTIYKIADLA